jgi:hypothetical protein
MLDEFPVWAEVDLDAIAHNVAAIKGHVGDRVMVMARRQTGGPCRPGERCLVVSGEPPW